MTNSDVIIAGGGPSGSLAAYELARQGISVTLFEKAIFPRYKVCGAGLTHKILKEIPFNIEAILETEIHTFTFSSGFKEVFTRYNADPLIYCTMREKLDAFLLAKAEEAGAKVFFGTRVTDFTQNKDGVEVNTGNGLFRSRLLIGADGASATVARRAGLRDNIMPGLAWEAEIQTDPSVVKAFSQTVFLDWGTFPGGYGWVFPKKEHFSIGVGGPAHLSRWMLPYYRQFLRYLEFHLFDRPDLQETRIQREEQRLKTLSLKAWPIPVRIKKSRFHDRRVLIAGDAGGLTDPLTGEGIYYAVRSGKLAAEACSCYLQAKQQSLQSYSDAVNDTLMNELSEANRIKYIFNTVPAKIHGFVRDSERGWRAFGKVLRGERWYGDVGKGLGTWRFLWNPLCTVARFVSWFKERSFQKHGFPG